MADKPLTRDELIALSNQLDLDLKKTQLEAARMGLELTTIELEKHRNRKADLAATARDRVKQLREQEESQRWRIWGSPNGEQPPCPHKKRGMDLDGYRKGAGPEYAVFKHRWCNGDLTMVCQRCSNVVMPPVEPQRVVLAEVDLRTIELYGHKTPASAGFFGKDDMKGFTEARKLYIAAMAEYQVWAKMETDNVPSESNQLKQLSSSSAVFGFDRMYRLALHESLGIPIFQAQKWGPWPAQKARELAEAV